MELLLRRPALLLGALGPCAALPNGRKVWRWLLVIGVPKGDIAGGQQLRQPPQFPDLPLAPLAPKNSLKHRPESPATMPRSASSASGLGGTASPVS